MKIPDSSYQRTDRLSPACQNFRRQGNITLHQTSKIRGYHSYRQNLVSGSIRLVRYITCVLGISREGDPTERCVAILIKTSNGSYIWDCAAFISPHLIHHLSTLTQPLRGIAISHPHVSPSILYVPHNAPWLTRLAVLRYVTYLVPGIASPAVSLRGGPGMVSASGRYQ